MGFPSYWLPNAAPRSAWKNSYSSLMERSVARFSFMSAIVHPPYRPELAKADPHFFKVFEMKPSHQPCSSLKVVKCKGLLGPLEDQCLSSVGEYVFGVNPKLSATVCFSCNFNWIATILKNCIDVELVVDDLCGLEVGHVWCPLVCDQYRHSLALSRAVLLYLFT